MPDAIPLSRCADRIVIECAACSKHGDYSRDRLIERFGDIGMPDVKARLARDAGCVRALETPLTEPCLARFVAGTITSKE